MKDIILAGLSMLASIALVIIFVLFGWYIVWKLILSRSRFVRELLKGTGDSTISELKTNCSKVKKIRKD
ncbi:hypothetical protein NQ317_010796 [Molorchus minor]|uniref:ATP synthase F0 subunit 8 n=1 Tax=Molorchus minor TaxID=1323400 RepID=A0ABQ9J7G0_9CUCU|nr:hypothetical protein NQ317_010796 [Molorchus minor]